MKKMTEVFNGMLGRIGNTTFINYLKLEKHEEILASDSVMQELSQKVIILNEVKIVADKHFDAEGRKLRDAAEKRIKELINK